MSQEHIKELDGAMSGERNVIEISGMSPLEFLEYVKVVNVPCEISHLQISNTPSSSSRNFVEEVNNIPIINEVNGSISINENNVNVRTTMAYSTTKGQNTEIYEKPINSVKGMYNVPYSVACETNILNSNVLPYSVHYEKNIQQLNNPSLSERQHLEITTVPYSTSQDHVDIVNNVFHPTSSNENTEMNQVKNFVYHEKIASDRSHSEKRNIVRHKSQSSGTQAVNLRILSCNASSISEQESIEMKNFPQSVSKEINVPAATIERQHSKINDGMSPSYQKITKEIRSSVLPGFQQKNQEESCTLRGNNKAAVNICSTGCSNNRMKCLTFSGITVEEYLLFTKLTNLYFQQRDIRLSENFRKQFSNVKLLNGSTISLKVKGEQISVTLNCFLCSLPNYSRFTLENKCHEIRFVVVDGHYYLICKFCSVLHNWNHQPIFTDVVFFREVTYFCKWKCGNDFSVDKLYDHEKKCDAQLLLQCPIKSCKNRLKFIELDKHLKQLHSDFRPPYGYLIYNFYGGNLINLKYSRSPVKQIFVQSHIPIFLELVWENPVWKITLNCKIPNLDLRAVVLNGNFDFVALIKENGEIPHVDQIHLKCFLADPNKNKFDNVTKKNK